MRPQLPSLFLPTIYSLYNGGLRIWRRVRIWSIFYQGSHHGGYIDASFPIVTDAIQDAVLAPFRVLVSKSALRLYLNTLLFMGAAAFLIGISAIAYGIFYFKFIPTVGLQREVHLQFGYDHIPYNQTPSLINSRTAMATPGAQQTSTPSS